MKLIKEFEQLEFFEKQILKIAIVKGVDDLKNNKIHDSDSVFKNLIDEINEYDN